jgi:hypothetical protein
VSFVTIKAPPPPPITALSLGPGCVIVGTGHGPDFEAFGGQECTLTFPEGTRRFRVEGFSVDPGRGATINEAVAIDLRGADIATGRYALYHFEGAADAPDTTVPDDPCPAFKRAHRGPGLVARP